MTDAELMAAMGVVRDKLVVAIADVARGDHLRASEVLEEAASAVTRMIAQMEQAA